MPHGLAAIKASTTCIWRTAPNVQRRPSARNGYFGVYVGGAHSWNTAYEFKDFNGGVVAGKLNKWEQLVPHEVMAVRAFWSSAAKRVSSRSLQYFRATAAAQHGLVSEVSTQANPQRSSEIAWCYCGPMHWVGRPQPVVRDTGILKLLHPPQVVPALLLSGNRSQDFASLLVE